MTIMTIREKFERRVIELNHPECETYEEAIKKELSVKGCLVKNKDGWTFQSQGISETGKRIFYGDNNYYSTSSCEILGLPNTIGRVLKILPPSSLCRSIRVPNDLVMTFNEGDRATWKLTKENGQDCTAEDQSDETIKELFKLIKPL